MALPFIPGSAVSVTVTAADTSIGLTANSYDFNYGPARLTKSRLGAASADTLAGQQSGTFSLSGHTTDDNLPDLAALQVATGQPLEIEVTLNAAGAKHAYNAVAEIGYSVTGDGELDWSIDGDISGDVTFTAAP